MSERELSPRLSVCGASNDKTEVWNRVSHELGTSTKSSTLTNRYFGEKDKLMDFSIPLIEKNHCLIIEQDEVTNLANTNNLFISTFEKLWLKTKKYLSAVLSNREKILLSIFVKDLKNTIIKLMEL